MAKIVDLRGSSGQIVYLGESLGLPTSSSLSFDPTNAPIAGSLRYNPTTNAIEWLSTTATTWQSLTTNTITPSHFGAVGYVKNLSNCIHNGTTTITDTVESPFSPSDVGKTFYSQQGGTSSTVFITTVAAYVSPTVITLAAAPPASYTGRAIVAVDDSTAFTTAINYCYANKLPLVIDRTYMTGPQIIKDNMSIFGMGTNVSTIYLTPGSAGTNKYLFSNNSVTDYYQSFSNLKLNGLRDYQKDGANAVREDICLIKYAGSGNTPVIDVFNRYINLVLTESGTGLYYWGKGESKFAQLSVDKCTYAYNINAFDCTFTGCHGTAYGNAWHLGSSVGSCRFVGCKGYFTGYSTMPGSFGAGESACWYLNGSSNNDFVDCEGQESWGSVWFLSDAHRNSFVGCRGADAGCVYPAHGIGSDNSGQIRANWWLTGDSTDNRFAASTSGVGVHGATSYATHAFKIEGTSANNTGFMETDKNASGWATAKVSSTTSGVSNFLRIDGQMISPDKQTIWIPAAAIIPRITNGPSAGKIETAANKVIISSLDFNTSTQQFAQFRIQMPKSWDLGTITANAVWSHATTTTNFGVTWGINAISLSNGEDNDGTTFSSPVLLLTTGGNANYNYKTSESTAITVAGSPAAGDDCPNCQNCC
jgi:hypothetical protein